MLRYSDASNLLEASPHVMSWPAAELPRPQNLEEVLAIAYMLEREAAMRYGDLAICMRLVGRNDLADLFHELATAEQDHIVEVEGLAMRTLQRLPNLPASFRWQLPETFGIADRTVITNMLTPYEALVTAVHNEERAFVFWSSMAAASDDPTIREQAELMARQELLHAAALRTARRRCYRSGGRVQRRGRQSDPAEEMECVTALQRSAVQFLQGAASRASACGDEMSCALMQFACEEVAPTRKSDDAMAAEARGLIEEHTDAIALLFEAAGRIEQLGEAARECMEAHPELARSRELARLVKAAALQVAMLNRRLSELEPRLTALVGPVGQERASF